MSVIETHKLTKAYGQGRGVIDLDLDIEEGEVFGFIGPNGAGKSTTIRTLLGLIRPTSGSAKIFGKDIITDGPAIRQEIGYLPSEVFYYDGMRAKDLLQYSASFYRKPRKEMQQRIIELAERLNLDLDKKIEDLSYGNKKKVGIIQGLLHQPKLIILDEPTGGLDPLMQQTFFDILRQENERGATVLFSSHILSEVQKMCNRVGIIKDGRLIKIESVSSLRSKSYRRCRIESAETLDKKMFVLDGVSDLRMDGGNASFLYRGDINIIAQLCAALPLKNMWIEEPELEEIFLHYYQKEA